MRHVRDVIRMKAAGMPSREIARRVGAAPSTVRLTFAGHVTSTSRYLPAVLKSYAAVETEGHARELEAYFKSGSGKAVALKRLIRKQLVALPPTAAS